MDDYQVGLADGYKVGYSKAASDLLRLLTILKESKKPYAWTLAELEVELLRWNDDE